MPSADLIPNGDIAKTWFFPISGDHYIVVDEHPSPPDNSSIIGLYTDNNDVEIFDMTSVDMGGGSTTKIELWLNGVVTHASDSPEVSISIGAGTPETFQESGLTTIKEWHYVTFEVTYSQTDLNALRVHIRCDATASGRQNSIDTIYCKVTYSVSGYGNKVMGVASANIGKVSGVETANISKVKGV